MTRIEELAQRWIDGELDERGIAEMRELLRQPEDAARFAKLCGDERELRELLRRGSEPAAPGRSAPGRARRPRRVGVLVGASLALALGLVATWLLRRGDAGIGTLATVSGAVDVYRSDAAPVRAGERLRAGDRIAVGIGATCRIVLADGSTIALAERTQATVASDRALTLELGSADVVAKPRPPERALRLATPHARCEVLGTRFTVSVDAVGSRIVVGEGRVRWQPLDGPEAIVAAGDDARAGDELLIGYDFRAGRADQQGSFSAQLPITPRPGERLRFVDGGLFATRPEQIHWERPGAAPLEALAERLRRAASVSLSARVRFATAIPRNVSIATLLCMRPDDNDLRFLPVRWKAAGVPAGDGWHDVRVTLHRDGRHRFFIDGICVLEERRPWIFAAWDGAIVLLIHTHQDLPPDPIDIVYAWVGISVS